jgi:hypothetical protein
VDEFKILRIRKIAIVIQTRSQKNAVLPFFVTNTDLSILYS